MNAESFSLKARRTTRVSLRVPVQVGVEEAGQPKSLDGWTIIVNIHGAKIECKRQMRLGETVKVTVPLTRRSQSGNIVWSTAVANAAGNFEFAVELTEPGNLWGVGFPPSDWKGIKAEAGPVAVEEQPVARVLQSATPATLRPPSAAPLTAAAQPASGVASADSAAKKLVIPGYELKPIVPFTINKQAPAPAVPAPAASVPVAAAELKVEPALTGTDSAPVDAPSSSPADATMAAPEPPAEPLPMAPLPEMPLMADPIMAETSMNTGDGAASQGAITVASEAGSSDDLTSWLGVSAEQSAAGVAVPMLAEQLFESVPDDVQIVAEPEMPLCLQEDEFLALETSGTKLELCATNSPENYPANDSASLPWQSEPSSKLPAAIPELGSVVENFPLPALPATAPATGPAIEKSFAHLTELAETAFQARIDGMVERAGANMDARLAELEDGTLERMDKKLSAVSEDHYERLDQHSESLAASRRMEFEQGLAKFAEATDTVARNRQQETIARTEQDLRRRSAELALHAQGRMQRDANEAAESAQSAIATKLQDLLPAVELEVGERMRQQAEQIHMLHRNQFEATLAARIEDARAYWQEQIEAMQKDAFSALTASLENHMAQQGTAVMQQMDQGMIQLAAQVQKTFFKHVVAELSSQQQAWIANAQRDMDNLTDKGVHRMRRQLVQLLGAMGEALVHDGQQPALPEGAENPSTAHTAAHQQTPHEMADQAATSLEMSFNETASVAQRDAEPKAMGI